MVVSARFGRKHTALGVLLALMATAVAAVPAVSAAAAPVPRIAWHPCGGPYDCATVQVPLDHDDPGGPKIALALARLPASDPARRIGSLFINPGGPGGSGVDLILAGGAGVLWSAEVQARFDIVGFDPRGVAASTPVQCFASNSQENAFLEGVPLFPYQPSQVGPYIERFRELGQRCLNRAGPILRHMSTANVARDLDLLRQAVGDAKLTYDGASYGSVVGNTYVNLFPDKVRAVVVDGVLDPVAWATGRRPSDGNLPMSMRVGSARGADLTLHQFLKQCDEAGKAACAFAGHAAEKLLVLLAHIRRAPLVLPDGLYTYDWFNNDLLGAMYDTGAWQGIGTWLQGLYDLTTGTSTTGAVLGRPDRGFAYDNGLDAFLAVACSDTANPRDPSVLARAAAHQAQFAPVFAENWVWGTGPCSTWPVVDEDRYLGPFDKVTSAPVLVIGNRYDPATPLHGAKATASLLPRSRLLLLNTSGHTSWLESACIDAHVTRYLVSGSLPPVGTVCAPDFQPFAANAPAANPAVAQLRGGRPRW